MEKSILSILSRIIVDTIDTLDNGCIEQWKSSIANDHGRIMKISKCVNKSAMRTYGILSEMNICINRYNQLQKAGFLLDAENEAQRLFELVNQLKPASRKVNVDADCAIEELKKFTHKHVEKVGMVQAVKDFQMGMNLLKQDRKHSCVASKQQLKEDGDFGEKTFCCFLDACKCYSPKVIKKHIKRGAIKNAVFATKGNSQINTEKLVCGICEDLRGE
jgi:hypothetical protein